MPARHRTTREQPAFRTRGQPSATAFVAAAIGRERAPHAILFVGPAHVGKRTLALDLAAGLLCMDEDPRARPCRSCIACRKVEGGVHPDVHLVAPEGAGEQIRLPQAQALTASLALLPMEGRIRVAVVEAAHRLNPDAQNALLKTLEEPPEGVCLVLAADDTMSLLPTVVSRTARIRLGPVAAADIAALLVERGSADASRAAALARLAAGRPGLALALATQPDATLIHDRLSRSLLDLLRADRRTRLAAAAPLLADGTALDLVLRGGGSPGNEPEEPERAARGTRRSAAATHRPSPVERRRAVARILEVWRGLARDLAVAGRGGRREIGQVELLDDLSRAGATVDLVAAAGFLTRLDRLAGALDDYANPELILDTLLLAWPWARDGAA